MGTGERMKHVSMAGETGEKIRLHIPAWYDREFAL